MSYGSIREAARSLRAACPLMDSMLPVDAPSVSNIPAFECFATRISKSSATEKFEEDVQLADVLVVKVKRFDVVGAYVKPLCTYTRLKRDLEWLDIQMLTPLSALSRRLQVGEMVLAEVVTVNPLKINLIEAPPLSNSQLPEYFRLGRDLPDRSTLGQLISEREDLRNPYLDTTMGFPTRSSHSFLKIPGLDKDRAETAAMMRKQQDHNLAMESVVRGVDEMKSGNRQAAVGHFNHALSIAPKCVDALVARGAAYSNDGMYVLAEKDFDAALDVQIDHVNARKYIVETLVQAAAILDVQGSYREAYLKYEKALGFKEDRRARAGLEKLKKYKDGERPRSPSVEIIPAEDKSADKRKAEQEEAAARKRRRESDEKEEKHRKQKEKQKLREMEAFIEALKKK